MKKRTVVLLVACGVLLVLSSLAAATVQQKSSTQRQGWEYKTLVYTIDANGIGSLIEDGKPASGSPVSKAPQLGAEGWELTGFTSVPNIHTDTVVNRISSSPTFVYWFKRPL
jgi:hypothetical protein